MHLINKLGCKSQTSPGSITSLFVISVMLVIGGTLLLVSLGTITSKGYSNCSFYIATRLYILEPLIILADHLYIGVYQLLNLLVKGVHQSFKEWVNASQVSLNKLKGKVIHNPILEQ